jgi:hypothetical protein
MMKHLTLTLMLTVSCYIQTAAQKTYLLPVSKPVTNDTEKMSDYNGDKVLTDVVKPAIEVYLPDADKAMDVPLSFVPAVH